MRRLFMAAVLCVAVLLPAGIAAASPAHQAGDGHHAARSAAAPAEMSRGLAGKARFASLGARLSAAATLYGNLYDSNGAPRSGATVRWYSLSAADQKWYWSDNTTDATGYFGWTNVLPTSDGELWAYPDADSALALGGETWATGGSYPYTLYPGRVQVTSDRSGPWRDYDSLVVRFQGATRYSKGLVPAYDGSSTPVSGLVDVLDGSYAGGSVEFFWDEGIEFYGSLGVTSGVTSGAAINVSEAAAQRVWFASPYWYSGRPGATVTMRLEGFPAGWINRVTGYTDDPDGTASQTYGTWTSPGATASSVKVKVPAAAKPGYAYWIGFQHVDASGSEYPLYLEEIYQVSTLKASKTSVRRGARIRVTGIVPTQGHWGSQAGLNKVVTLYAHKGVAAVPTRWNPKKQGWVKVGSVRTNGYGAYATPYFKPLKTLTLVARYPGDNWYLDAYTSTQKVRVR
jgi:hypothetical protein